MKKILISILVVSIPFIFTACYHDNVQDLYPALNNQTTCDTTNVTFTSPMQSFFNNNCVGCHGGSNAVGNFDTYAHAFTFYQSKGMIIYNTVTGSTPHNSIVLTDCEKAQLKRWIEMGAPQ